MSGISFRSLLDMTLRKINFKTRSSSSIIQEFRYIEWTILSASFLFRVIYFFRYINHSDFWIFIELTLFFGYVVLSFIFPVSCSPWQKRVYILLEVLLALSLQSIHHIYSFLLYVLYAKICFLLNRKGVIFTLTITGVAWGIIKFSNLTVFLHIHTLPKGEKALALAELREYNPLEFNNVVVSLFMYFGISTFVILLSLLVMAERKSRRRAEVLAQEVETLAATLERTRIAREIHDSLGHTLTTLNVQLELAQALCDRDPQQTRQSLDKAKQLASQGLKDVRQALQTLRQHNRNLNEDLSNLIAEFRQISSANSQSIAISSTINLPPLPLQMGHQIYHIVKEGLTNIQKHAHASRVIVKASLTTDGITLELGDNGKGFNSQTSHPGFGLRGMQERVQLLGGQFQIHSTPDRGTLIQVTVPYDSTASS